MNKWIAALTTAAALTLSSLTLTSPALAADAPPTTPTQEVASSPESTSTTESSPTTPSVSPTPQSETPTPTAETVTPPTGSSDTATRPTVTTPEPTTTTPSTAQGLSAPTPPSSLPSAETPAPFDGWDTWLISGDGSKTGPVGHVSVGAEDFPQSYLGSGQVAPTCGQYVQQDRYVGTVEQHDALLAAGDLVWNGHASDQDFGLQVADWQLVYGGDCPPQPGPANPAGTSSATCGAATVTITNDGENILTASVVIYVDGAFTEALAIPAGGSETRTYTFGEDTGDHGVSVRTGPAFGDVLVVAQETGSDCIPPQPEAKTFYGEWVDSEIVCDATTVDQTRTVTTANYVLVDGKWVLDLEHADKSIDRQTRKLDADEIVKCPVTPPTTTPTPTPTPTPVATPTEQTPPAAAAALVTPQDDQLAQTGSNEGALAATLATVAGLMFCFGILFLLIRARRAARK